MADRTIRGKENRRIDHGHPIKRQGQRAIVKENNRLYEKVVIDNKWYKVPLLLNDEVYPPEPSDIRAVRDDGVVWTDLRVAASSVKVIGASNVPGYSTPSFATTSLQLLAFSPDTMEQVFFTAQLGHDFKAGSVIYPHVHWHPANDAAEDGYYPRWGLEYSVTDVGDDFPNSVFVYGTTPKPADSIVLQGRHYKTPLSTINLVNETANSPMLVCRLFRDATHLDDTYESDAQLLEIDFHYQIDAIGSRQLYVK